MEYHPLWYRWFLLAWAVAICRQRLWNGLNSLCISKHHKHLHTSFFPLVRRLLIIVATLNPKRMGTTQARVAFPQHRGLLRVARAGSWAGIQGHRPGREATACQGPAVVLWQVDRTSLASTRMCRRVQVGHQECSLIRALLQRNRSSLSNSSNSRHRYTSTCGNPRQVKAAKAAPTSRPRHLVRQSPKDAPLKNTGANVACQSSRGITTQAKSSRASASCTSAKHTATIQISSLLPQHGFAPRQPPTRSSTRPFATSK